MKLYNNYYFNEVIDFNLLTFTDNIFIQSINYTMDGDSFTHIKIVREIGYKYTDYTMFYEQRKSGVVQVSIPVYSVLIDNKTKKFLNSDWQCSDENAKNQMQSITFATSGVEVDNNFYSWFINNTLATDEMILKKVENLKNKIEAKTKNNFTTLTEAINFLLSKYQ
jgi:transcriptional regulator of met regulon